MVVDNPLTSEQEESLNEDLDEVYSGGVDIEEVNTSKSDSYDFRVVATEMSEYSMRQVIALVKWYDDRGEWEIKKENSGSWRS
jgi:hypothetical protein